MGLGVYYRLGSNYLRASSECMVKCMVICEDIMKRVSSKKVISEVLFYQIVQRARLIAKAFNTAKVGYTRE